MSTTTRQRTTAAALALVALIALTGCAPDANALADTGTNDAGFLLGLWHGLIAPITFVVSLFSDTVGVYEVHNTGGWYDFGFLLGVGGTLGGSGAASSR